MGKNKPTPPSTCNTNQISDYAKEQFERDYEFRKPLSERLPLTSSYQVERIQRNEPWDYVDPRERAMVQGKMAGYGHNATQMKGALRTSGHKGAHQIGKRK